MQNLKGKIALITGASSGIGKATAIGLAELGVSIIAVGRRRSKLEALKKVSGVEIVEQDISQDLAPLKSAIQNRKIDILINNAGFALGREPIEKMPTEDWNQMIDTNIKGLIAVTQMVLPQMIERKSGDIVNLGSIAGYQVYPSGSIYNATKFAVRALTDAWRLDLMGKGIRVIGIHPGMVETEFSIVRYKGDEAKAKQVYEGMTPLSADDIAKTIIWSLSCPSHMTIQSMVVMPTEQGSANHVFRNPS